MKDDADLLKFSGEHLHYELTMFWWLTGVVPFMDGYMKNALLEAWVVHLRNLINFFCRSRDRDDVIAADFMDDPAKWSLGETDVLAGARVRADKELSHITAKRKDSGDPEKAWDIPGLQDAIATLVQKFVAESSHAKLHRDVREMFVAPKNRVTVLLGQTSNSTGTTTP